MLVNYEVCGSPAKFGVGTMQLTDNHIRAHHLHAVQLCCTGLMSF